MKKPRGNLFDRLIGYMFREPLDIKHRLTNLIMVVLIIVQVPTLFLSFYLETDLVGLIAQILACAITLFAFCFLNKNTEAKWPIVLLVAVVNLLLFPIMYVTSGGRRGGMLLWILMGLIFIWVLLEGKEFVICAIVDTLMLVGLIAFEYYYPDKIVRIAGEGKEAVDVLVAVVAVSVILGFLYKYQSREYEHQRIMLEEQKSILTEQKKELEKQTKILAHQKEMLIIQTKTLEDQTVELENRKKILEEQEKQLKEVNGDLERASQAKSDFLAHMSHEIRTPINAVLGMNEMILRESKDDGITTYATDIDMAGHQLLSLVNDILDFSKIESGKMEIHPAEYELFSVMNDCYNMINMRARKKNLEFKVINNPNIPAFLVGDEIRVRQIIINLLTNAVKYTHEGFVSFGLDYEKRNNDKIMLIIEVADSGIGISEENISKLFGSFSRIDENRNKNIEGTGLGLAITKQLIELMHGTIRVESKEGLGSKFIVKIPQIVASDNPVGEYSRQFDKPVAMREAAPEADSRAFEAPEARVLVVDDVKMNLNVARLLLKKTKIQIDMASSGKEALDYIKMKHFDIILMDHMMPEMDGIETFHKMREMEDSLNIDTPVIVLTANAIQGVEEMYMQEGFCAYLSKPIKGVDLEGTLLKFLPEEKVIYNES